MKLFSEDKPIQIMDPTPGNGWGCIQAVDLIRMMRALGEKQGKAVKVKAEGRAMRLIGKWLLIVGSLYFAINLIIWAVRP